MHRISAKTKLGAFLLGSALALGVVASASDAHAQGAAVGSATAEQKDAAQKAFVEGTKLAKAGKHEEALAAFKRSYDAVASPNPHLMMARELVALGRLEEAYVEYEKTQAEAEAAAAADPKYAATGDQAKAELADVRGKVALLKLNVTGTKPGDRVTVRGREIPQADWGKPVPVMAGAVRVELQSSTGEETVREVNATAGGEVSVDLTPAPKAGAAEAKASGEAKGEISTSGGKPNLRTWAYVAGGVGVAGLITFGVFGAMNNAKHNKLEDQCKSGSCPSNLEEERDTGRTYQTVANIGLVVGIVGLGAGTALFLMSGKSEKTAEHVPPRAPRAPRITQVGVGYQSVMVSGSF